MRNNGTVGGNVNIPIEKLKYIGISSDTAETIVDNKASTIQVNVIKKNFLDLTDIEPTKIYSYDAWGSVFCYWEFDNLVEDAPGQLKKISYYNPNYNGGEVTEFTLCPRTYSPFDLYFGRLEATSENSADVYGFVVYENKVANFITSISIETDAETGDARVVVGDLCMEPTLNHLLSIEFVDDPDFNDYGLLVSVGQVPSGIREGICYLFESLDTELVKKLMGEPQVEEE